MQDNFARDLKQVLVLEGGYVNNPADPGGATNFGVTAAVYDGYRQRKGLPLQNVRRISPAEVAEIYRFQYADKVHYDELPSGVDGVLFDGAVNSGPTQSIKWLQRAIGGLRVDGAMGEATLKAVAEYPDFDLLIARICERRMAFLKALKTYSTFGRGWSSRVDHVRRAGQAIASGSVGPNPVYYVGGQKKALIEYAKPLPSKGIADALSGGGVVSVGLDHAQTLLGNLSFIPHIDNATGVLTAIGGVALGVGVLARVHYTRKTTALVDALDLRPAEELAPTGAPA